MSAARLSAGDEQLAHFTLSVAPGLIGATVIRRADGSIRTQLDCGQDGHLLTDANLDALRRMLSECSAAAFEAELANRCRARTARPRTAQVLA